MKVAFRTDASLAIGTGHVMRCLTLADALAERGAECAFICRAHEGHLLEMIARRGHGVHTMPADAWGAIADDTAPGPPHAQWLGADWRTDAEETGAVLQQAQPDWLVVDHYALDRRWERALRPFCRRLMAIDDLADRLHDCDILLDQTYGRDRSDYAALVPDECRLLVGSRYALLRPEFSARRDTSLRRREGAVRRILMFMGGVDPQNATGTALAALKESLLPDDVRLTIVLGHGAPHLAEIREQARSLPRRAEVLAGVGDMAQLMAESDLAIGAAGTASWERCALGLPAVVVETAPNQGLLGRNLALAGAHWFLGPIGRLSTAEIGAVVSHAMVDPLALCRMAQAAAQVCDGEGARRASSALFASQVAVRRATLDDAEMLRTWRNHPSVRAQSFDPGEIAFDRHLEWLTRCLSDDSTVLLVAEADGSPAASVRFDVARDVAEISIYLNPSFMGRSLGPIALETAIGWLQENAPQVRRLRALVKEDNPASKGLFHATGFALTKHCFERVLPERQDRPFQRRSGE